MANLGTVNKIQNGQPLTADTLNTPIDDLESNQGLLNTEVQQATQDIASANERINTVATNVESINQTLAPEGYVGEWADQTGAANIPYSVSHNGFFWSLTNNLATVENSEPTDANANWSKANVDLTSSVSGYVTQTAIAMSIVFGG